MLNYINYNPYYLMMIGSVLIWITGTVYRQYWVPVMVRVTAVGHNGHWHWKYRWFTSLVIIILATFLIFTALCTHFFAPNCLFISLFTEISLPLCLSNWLNWITFCLWICYIDLIMFYMRNISLHPIILYLDNNEIFILI